MSQTSDSDHSWWAPIPDDATGEQLLKIQNARTEALDLYFKIEEHETELRDLRRKARAKLRHYEQLVAEYNGQLTLDQEVT